MEGREGRFATCNFQVVSLLSVLPSQALPQVPENFNLFCPGKQEVASPRPLSPPMGRASHCCAL